MMKCEAIPIADIYVPTKRRATLGQKRIDEIAASILDKGLQALILTRLRLRPTSCMGVCGYCKWTPVEPAGTCPGYKSSKLGGSGDPWTTGARDERSAIGGGSLA